MPKVAHALTQGTTKSKPAGGAAKPSTKQATLKAPAGKAGKRKRVALELSDSEEEEDAGDEVTDGSEMSSSGEVASDDDD